ncbi:MAG: four helix bundle protein [Thermodesulfovibrionales bacterium]|nr:four helix bundle protein [Thermodesulfovibrionales bacterium]
MDIIGLYKELVQKNEYVLSKQVLRSGTSIGANVEEAQAAQSKNDFTAKMSVASKEARETRYWLMLIKQGKFLSTEKSLNGLILKADSIINILTKIVKTSQKRKG